MAFYPALQIDRADDNDLALAVVDDFGPVAAEERGGSLLVFFQTGAQRDQASAAVMMAMPHVAVVPREIDDENWAQRSQENLEPIQVGAIVIVGDRGPGAGDSGLPGTRFPLPRLQAPAPSSRPPARSDSPAPSPQPPAPASQPPAPSPQSPLVIVIRPSMGFGTGHHATTRLCLAALQTLDIEQASVLDVGTGSGVLAIAARRLGAACALGIDDDPDAIQSARENLPLNPAADRIAFERRALGRDWLPAADLVLANLTGALLCRTAGALIDLVNPNGHLVVSGLMKHERDEVRAACSVMELIWEAHEDEWVGLCLKRRQAVRSAVSPDGGSAAKKV